MNRYIRLLISDINSDSAISYKVCRAANYYNLLSDLITNLRPDEKEKLSETINMAFSEALLEYGKAVCR